MRFHLAPKGVEAEKAALESGLRAKTDFNALFHWTPLPFRNASEARMFIVGGQAEDETIGPLLHEFTHFWHSLSPVFTAIRFLKHRAVRRHYELAGNSGSFRLTNEIFSNYLNWRFALSVESLFAPLMEGSACLAEFDSPLPSRVPEAFRTPADRLLLKMQSFKHASQQAAARALRRDLPAQSFDEFLNKSFLRHFSKNGDRARRKSDLYTLHPLMMRQGRGSHLLGYLSLRDIYLSIICRPGDQGTDVRDTPLSLFLHAVRMEFLFDETLTQLIFRSIESYYATYDDIPAALSLIDQRLQAILRDLIENPGQALARTRRALEIHGPAFGVPHLMTPDGRPCLAVHTSFEAEVYEAGQNAVAALAQSAPPSVASGIAASWLRRTSLLTGTTTMRLANAPGLGGRKGHLRVTAQEEKGAEPFVGMSDAYPISAFDTKTEIPVAGYIGFVNGDPTFLNAFEIGGQTMLTAIGVEGKPFVMTGPEAQSYGLNAIEATNFHQLIDNISLVGRATTNIKALETRLDDDLSQLAANIYLDRVSPTGPLGQLFMAAQSRGEELIGEDAVPMLRRPNLAYESFASAALTQNDWTTYILWSLCFGLGGGLRDFDEGFRETVPDALADRHDALRGRDKRLRLFVKARNGNVYAVF